VPCQIITHYFGKTSLSLHKCSERGTTYVSPHICMKLMTLSELSMTDFAKNLFPKTYQITTPLKAVDQIEFMADGIWNYVIVSNIIVSNLFLNIKINRTVMLPVVLYGRLTWFLTLREKYRVRVFENRVLRRIFGTMREEATGEWRLTYEKFYALYSSPNIIRVIKSRRMRWVGPMASVGNRRDA